MENYNASLTDQQRQRLESYAGLIAYWTKTHNITASSHPESIRQNIRHSLCPLGLMEDLCTVGRIFDIGSGAGFPAIPLAVAMPESFFVLAEPLAKKSSFLHLVKSELKLENVEVFRGRVESHESDTPFDLITSRAVTQTDVLINISSHLLSENGRYLLYKGEGSTPELDLIPKPFRGTILQHEKWSFFLLQKETH